MLAVIEDGDENAGFGSAIHSPQRSIRGAASMALAVVKVQRSSTHRRSSAEDADDSGAEDDDSGDEVEQITASYEERRSKAIAFARGIAKAAGQPNHANGTKVLCEDCNKVSPCILHAKPFSC
jgi:hypothetical protein